MNEEDLPFNLETTDKEIDNNLVSHEEEAGFFRKAWKWLTEDKEKLGSIIFLSLFIILIIVLAALNLNLGEIMSNIIDWFYDKLTIWGIYLGVFLISIFGNFTVIFPVPYTLALIAVAQEDYILWYHILIMGLFAGAGAALGETSAWLLGKASKNVIKDGMEKQVARAQKWIDKGIAPIMILLFAATPLPDDAILIFIGLLGYALWKTVIWCFLGKIILTSFTGLIAKFIGDTNTGQVILRLFGLTDQKTPAWQSALTWIGTIVLIGVIIFVDWGDVWNKLTRSMLKRKYSFLVKTDITQQQPTMVALTSDLAPETGVPVTSDSTLWQCVLQDEKEEHPNYFDFYTVSYVLGKSANILLEPGWYEKFENNVLEKRFLKTNHYKLQKIITGKETPEEDEETQDMQDDIADKMMYVSFNSMHPETNKNYKIGFLLERLPEDKLKIKCISEREALAIKSFKSVHSELVLSKLVLLLNNLSDNPESVKKATVAF